MNFRNIAFLMAFFLVQVFYAQSGPMLPELPAKGRSMQNIIPTNWKILSKASGDLNGDGYKDIVFAIESPIEKKYVYKDSSDSDTLHINPRILGIYFGKRNGKFKKVLQSNAFIINQNTPTMEEPFKGLQILPNGELQIDFYIWPCRECTTWSSHEYIFRFQNRAFELVEYKESAAQRVSGEEMNYSIDFQNKTLKMITETRNEDDEREYKETLQKFELDHLKTIQSLGKPFEWEFQQLRI
ncbi:hypothetical protein J8L85_00155 [Maribacter sp. MMG018]|uniref:hypothetical protein n=1 Tax=Maribacter sp. MMG018 TaxID=2822688 RepID=UPI001B35D4A3|nr:hypothetical protein [Maribacter sp. MMG018]MBQ4912826.1 hypothetical protein [Maribacter sp. MMG018]